MREKNLQIADGEWITFPGGELEGRRIGVLCQPCREHLNRGASARAETPRARPLCFRCYRAGLARESAFAAAGQLDTASEARFQCTLPFEPVNRARLETLRAERASVRATMNAGAGQFSSRRRRAQIAARRTLQAVAAGLKAHRAAPGERRRVMAESVHAAEMQLPEAWIPFVVSR
jgi:hypothetical protein